MKGIPLIDFEKRGLRSVKYFIHLLTRNGELETRAFAFAHEIQEAIPSQTRESQDERL
jgi:hypothetical protein